MRHDVSKPCRRNRFFHSPSLSLSFLAPSPFSQLPPYLVVGLCPLPVEANEGKGKPGATPPINSDALTG
jgi:hypothetical protein